MRTLRPRPDLPNPNRAIGQPRGPHDTSNLLPAQQVLHVQMLFPTSLQAHLQTNRLHRPLCHRKKHFPAEHPHPKIRLLPLKMHALPPQQNRLQVNRHLKSPKSGFQV